MEITSEMDHTSYPTTALGSTTTFQTFAMTFAANATKNKTYSRTLNAYDYAIPAVGSLAIVLNLAVVISSGLILKKGNNIHKFYNFYALKSLF